MHDAPESMIVVHGIVLRAAVVPEGDRAAVPTKAAGELGSHLVLEQTGEQRCALPFRPILELCGVRDVHVERLALRFRVRTHDRMFSDEYFQICPSIA